MVPAGEALQRLKDGNSRYAAGIHSADENVNPDRRIKTSGEQTPFAIVLGCSDSRVPAEYVFDQGIGDLFVIRVAGNIAASSQIASIEFAIATFATSLVVVLGHAQCGAVIATLDEVRNPSGGNPRHIDTIVDRVRPSVESVIAENPHAGREEIIESAVRRNIGQAMSDLSSKSELIAEALETGDLMIVGAEYSLNTGDVRFFD